LCFTAKLSSNLGKLKTLCEAFNGEDAQKWKDAIADEILNFLNQDVCIKVQMSQVHAE